MSAASSPATISSGASQPGASLAVAAVVTWGAFEPGEALAVGRLRRGRRGHLAFVPAAAAASAGGREAGHVLELARVAAAAGAAAHAAALAARRELVGQPGAYCCTSGGRPLRPLRSCWSE